MRILLSIFFFLLLQTLVVAQSFNGGILGGLTASEISGDNLGGPNKAGPLVGVFINHTLNNDKYIQFEMYYVQKGSRKNPNSKFNDFTKYVLRINYIEMPVLLILKPFKDMFRPMCGVSYAVHFGDTERDQNGLMPKPDNFPQFKPYDVSLIGGAIFKISDKININFRYSRSMLAVRQHNGGGTYYFNRGQYSSVWYLSLHYLFKSKVE